MTSIIGRFRIGIISAGAFALGIAFEKNIKTTADIRQTDISGDIVDSSAISGKNLGSSETSLIVQYGFPSMDSLRSYSNFVVSYDRRSRIPNWVLERLTRDKLNSDNYNRSGMEFFEDKSVHHFFRSTNNDYKGSGYDRGHLAAAGNYRSIREHAANTFILTNIAPQVGRGFNRDKWNDVEKYARKIVHQVGEAWICTGPLFLPTKDPITGKMFVRHEVIGRNHVAVPTHFFKVIFYRSNNDSNQFMMESFLFPNVPIDSNRDVTEFRIDPEVIERAAGILLFNGILNISIDINKLIWF